MGCGASRDRLDAAGEDAYLEHISFMQTDIDFLDDFFDELEDPLNMLVDFHNDVNAALDDVLHAVAKVSGAFFLKVTHAPDIDFVLLKAVGPLTPELRQQVKQQDRELSDALEALRAVLETDPSMTLRETIGTGVNEIETDYVAARPAVQLVNEKLRELRAVLPKNVKIDASVRMAADPGASLDEGFSFSFAACSMAAARSSPEQSAFI